MITEYFCHNCTDSFDTDKSTFQFCPTCNDGELVITGTRQETTRQSEKGGVALENVPDGE